MHLSLLRGEETIKWYNMLNKRGNSLRHRRKSKPREEKLKTLPQLQINKPNLKTLLLLPLQAQLTTYHIHLAQARLLSTKVSL
jgi:hypothetical protein